MYCACSNNKIFKSMKCNTCQSFSIFRLLFLRNSKLRKQSILLKIQNIARQSKYLHNCFALFFETHLQFYNVSQTNFHQNSRSEHIEARQNGEHFVIVHHSPFALSECIEKNVLHWRFSEMLCLNM